VINGGGGGRNALFGVLMSPKRRLRTHSENLLVVKIRLPSKKKRKKKKMHYHFFLFFYITFKPCPPLLHPGNVLILVQYRFRVFF
jgi:hypothetical protein